MIEADRLWCGAGVNAESQQLLWRTLRELDSAASRAASHGRPRSLSYFDLFASRLHAERAAELARARERGAVVVGLASDLAPAELVWACGGVATAVAGSCAWWAQAAGDALGCEADSATRSLVGAAVSRTCPFMALSDLVVIDTLSDARTLAVDALTAAVPAAVHVLDVPRVRRAASRTALAAELRALADEIARATGTPLSVDRLRQAIRQGNARRRALSHLQAARGLQAPLIGGTDALLVLQCAGFDDPMRFIGATDLLVDELEAARAQLAFGTAGEACAAPRASGPSAGGGAGGDASPLVAHGGARLMVTGTPLRMFDRALHFLVEQCGGVVVCEDAGVGALSFERTVSDGAETVEGLIDALAAHIAEAPVPGRVPLAPRAEALVELAQRQGAQGVVCAQVPGSSAHALEAPTLERAAEAAGLPFMCVEYDLGSVDSAALRMRLGAFIEMLAS
ncbi:2-hydroxyacyl-CoA dehydratase [Berryella wangjianweii]|uniref:2-hydroxyacyl-CoA dehydratase n=1 Tax=Berryella wangjianweii TaxID=2734634 RepID=A0A6M8J716_9ACTN|nr:2-hydroxyacyl-CoA dehydratase family protein [Berryella wangjianweii]QKF07398.1 2-hydroxyacyl-CoA dehydratase [Berryella wangjianweii]